MRKYLIAATVAATLLAGQAMASDSVDTGDLATSSSATSNDMAGMGGETALFLLAGAVLIGFVAYEATNSQQPTSP